MTLIDHLKRIAITVGILGAVAFGLYLIFAWILFCDSRNYGFLVISPFMALIAFAVWKIVGNCMKSK